MDIEMLFGKKKQLGREELAVIDKIAVKHPKYSEHFKNIALKDKKCTPQSLLATYNIVVQYRDLVRNEGIDVFSFKSAEKLYDTVNAAAVISEKQRYVKSFISKKYEHLLSDKVTELFYAVKGLGLSKKDINAVVMKGAYKFQSPKDLEKALDNFIHNAKSTIVSKIQDIEKTGAVVVYRSHVDNILIAKIPDYKSAKFLGPSSWCICRSESYWDQYMCDEFDNHHRWTWEQRRRANSNHKGYNRWTGLETLQARDGQYFIWDFTKEPSNPLHLIGVTIRRSLIASAFSQDNDSVKDRKFTKELVAKVPGPSFSDLRKEFHSKINQNDEANSIANLMAWMRDAVGGDLALFMIIDNAHDLEERQLGGLGWEIVRAVFGWKFYGKLDWGAITEKLGALDDRIKLPLIADIEKSLVRNNYLDEEVPTLIKFVEALKNIGSKIRYTDLAGSSVLLNLSFIKKLNKETGEKIVISSENLAQIFIKSLNIHYDLTSTLMFFNQTFANDVEDVFSTADGCEKILEACRDADCVITPDARAFIYRMVWRTDAALAEEILVTMCAMTEYDARAFLKFILDSNSEDDLVMLSDIANCSGRIMDNARRIEKYHDFFRSSIGHILLNLDKIGFAMELEVRRILAECVLDVDSKFSEDQRLFVCEITDARVLSDIVAEGRVKLDPLIGVMLKKIPVSEKELFDEVFC